MKLIQRVRTHTKAAKSEQGMVIAIALLMGLMLAVASGGLLAKQLMLRRLGAAESYKQLAEMAATSGMNRLLAALNSRSPDLSYLWELKHVNTTDENIKDIDGAEKQWDLPAAEMRSNLSQPCYAIKDKSAEALGLLEGDLADEGENLRDDGRNSQVQASYRLRSYKFNNDARTFEIEGYATQANGTQVLSRSLLNRVLFAEEAVASNEHWGVIGAKKMILGPSKIIGQGLALWLIDKGDDAAKNESVRTCKKESIAEANKSTDDSMKQLLWPKIGEGNQFPDLGLFADHNVHADELWIDTSSPTPVRINFNSEESEKLRGMISRSEEDDSITRITLHSEYLCNGLTDKPCLVPIKKIKLTDGIDLSIETGQGNQAKPVILRLIDEDSTIDLSSTGRLCQAASSKNHSDSTLECNDEKATKAEELIILSTTTNKDLSCSTNKANLILNGNSLPAAVVLMPRGKTLLTGATTMKGLLWSSSLCAGEGLTLKTTNEDKSEVIAGFRELWPGKSFQFGRTAWRGIRGKKHDVFVRW